MLAICSNSGADNDTVGRIVDYLMEKDCFLDLGDKYGQTPLMCAISSGRVELAEKLLDKDARLEMRDTQGWTVRVHTKLVNAKKYLRTNVLRTKINI